MAAKAEHETVGPPNLNFRLWPEADRLRLPAEESLGTSVTSWPPGHPASVL